MIDLVAVRLILAIIAVVVIIYLSYVVSKYLAVGTERIHAAKYMKVVDRIPVGQDRSILILEIGGKHYLIGNTPQSIEILKELEDGQLVEIPAEKSMLEQINGKSFQSSLRAAMKRKER